MHAATQQLLPLVLTAAAAWGLGLLCFSPWLPLPDAAPEVRAVQPMVLGEQAAWGAPAMCQGGACREPHMRWGTLQFSEVVEPAHAWCIA